MDYSKRGINKKRKQMGSTGSRAEKKFGYTAFRVVIIAIVLVAVVGVSMAIGGVRGIIDSSPDINVDDIAPDAFKSYMYLEDGTQLLELADSGSNRVEIDITQMSENVQNAFIALEDERFWEHNGIDPKGITRAFVVGIRNGGFSEGASTITQQLIKNAVFSGGNEENMLLKFKRKFQEQFLAISLEKQLSKEKILQAYLNTINLGETCYGVEAASQMYFNKHASNLTVSEAAVLAAIAKSPTNFDPYLYPENNKNRREICLGNLLDQGYIDQDEYDKAMKEDLYASIKTNVETSKTTSSKVTTYYEDAAINKLISDFVDLYGYVDDPTTVGVDEAVELAKHKLYSGGYKIYLVQDPALQSICDAAYADDSNFPSTEYLLNWALTVYNDDGSTSNYSVGMLEQRLKEYYGQYTLLYSGYDVEERVDKDIQLYMELEGIPDKDSNYSWRTLTPQVQSSFVLMDQHTGFVKAIVGGRGTKTTSRSFNRATDAKRQPGSVFKIVSTYAPAIDQLGKTLASTNLDSPYTVTLVNGDTHTFHNVDFSYTEGPMTFREAIIRSKNTVATRTMLEDVTPEYAVEFLRDRFHFTTLVESDKVTSLALGGLTYGVTNYELTAAIAAIANQGVYNVPILYSKVLDHDGNIVIDNSVPETSVAVKSSTAYLLTDAMKGVVSEPYGTGVYAHIDGMNVAGKTGTTDYYRDLWFVGFTPYYTAGIWFGYDNNASLEDRGIYDYNRHKILWKNIMSAVVQYEGQVDREFPIPSNIEKIYVCSETGLLASSSCYPVETYVDIDDAPTEYCTGHYYYFDDYDTEGGEQPEGEGGDSMEGTVNDDFATILE